MIIEELQQLATPIDRLEEMPGNPRKGNVYKVAESLREFGQHRPIVCRVTRTDDEGNRRGEVIAGNHTLQAAKQLGWDEVAVVWIDEDPKRALARSLADNRSSDDSTYDDHLLADALKSLNDDFVLREAAGFDPADVQEIISRLEDVPETRTPYTGLDSSPVVQYQIVFDSEEQQQTWFKFMRWLKSIGTGATIAERLTNFLEEVMPDEQ